MWSRSREVETNVYERYDDINSQIINQSQDEIDESLLPDTFSPKRNRRFDNRLIQKENTIRDGNTFEEETIKMGKYNKPDNSKNNSKNNNSKNKDINKKDPNSNNQNPNNPNQGNNNINNQSGSGNTGGLDLNNINNNLPPDVELGTKHSNPGTGNTDWAQSKSNISRLNENIDNNSSMDNPLGDTSIFDDTQYNSSIEGDDGSNYIPDYESFNLYDAQSAADTSTLDELFGIHGLPYQFMSTVDLRLNDLDGGVNFPYGMEYTERIINRMPLLLVAPGRASFMQDFNKHQKETVFDMLVDGEDGKALSDIFDPDKSGRYYTFRFNYKDYFDFVNGMNWASAIYLGLGDKPFMGTTYKDYMWNNYTNKSTKSFFMGSEFVCFYVDSENQSSDNFSNETGPSMLDSGVSKLSDIAKEVDFLLGAGAGVDIQKWILSHGSKENMESNYEQANEILSKYNDPANIMGKLKSGMYTIAGGGHLIFPEIYKDSTYTKTYTINLKFVAPDGDTETIYREIISPLNHLHGFVLPMQMGYNGYRSPFLVKMMQKGLFNIEAGMITDMTVTKGGDGSWNVDGLPTEVNVSLTVKDMYQLLAMTKWKDSHMFFNNTQFLDFIATMCGIVICKPELAMKLDMVITNFTSKFTHIPAQSRLKMSQAITNQLRRRLDFFTR